MSNEEQLRLVEIARRNTLLYRIISGKNEYRDSYIKEPSCKIREKGFRIYYDVLKDCIDVLSDRDIYVFLLDTKQWKFTDQKKLDELPKDIENAKVRYFSDYQNPAVRREHLFEINYKKKLYRDLFIIRNKYTNLTSTGIATGAMWFEMINFMYNGTDKLAAINFYHSNTIQEEDMRHIALSDEWMSYCGASRNTLGKSALRMTEDQRRLMTWSNLYKNCRSNMDAPSDEIFHDHDAFDGWLITERRKHKITKKVESLKGIDPKASNVYLFGKNKEDFEEIISLNTPSSLMKIENEFKQK